MFIGYLSCGACGYRTEEFMCLHHHWPAESFGVVLQDRATRELRIVQVPDDDVFYLEPGQDEADRAEAVEDYVRRVVAAQASAGERQVEVEEFLREGSESLRCPRCERVLAWENTGIM